MIQKRTTKYLLSMLFFLGIFFSLHILNATAEPGQSNLESPVLEPVYPDVNHGDPNAIFINYLSNRGLIKGFPDGTFKPYEGLSRAEAAALLVRAANLSPAQYTNRFSDVSSGHWAAGDIESAAKAGLIKGFPDGTFKPGEIISRAEGVALFLRLSKQSGAGADLPALEDVNQNYWAAEPVAVAVTAGMIGLSEDKKHFYPNAPLSRGDLSRILGILLTREPELNKTELPCQLRINNGTVVISRHGKEIVFKAGEQPQILHGDIITTKKAALVDLIYPDGSGLRLEENAELAVKQSRGRSYVQSNGKPGVEIDWLVLELKKGKLYGALASRYEKQTSGQQTAAYPLLASLNDGPIFAGLLMAESNEGNNTSNSNLPWWETAQTKKVRVQVDMPWSVAAIRGTFWINDVRNDGSSSTSLLTGEGEVRSGDQSVTLGEGQRTEVTEQGQPPAPPQAMTNEDRNNWLSVREWALERAQEIQSRQEPEMAPPPPAVQQLQNQIIPNQLPNQQQLPAPQQSVQSQIPQVNNPFENINNVINQAINRIEQTQQSQQPRQNEPDPGNNNNSSSSLSIYSAGSINETVTLTLSKQITNARINEQAEVNGQQFWVPEITIDGNIYRIGIWVWDQADNKFIYDDSRCLHGIDAVSSSVNSIKFIAQSGTAGSAGRYIARIYTGNVGSASFRTICESREFAFAEVIAPFGVLSPIQSHKLIFAGGIEINLESIQIPNDAKVKAVEVSPDLANTGLSAAGKVVDFTFEGVTFNGNYVDLTLPYNQGINSSTIGIFYKNAAGNWIYQDTRVNADQTVSAEVNHFSTYGVFSAPQVKKPVATPFTGVEGTGITLSTETPGAEIYYTTDGSTPTASSTIYQVGQKLIVPDGPYTIKAMAVKPNMINSEVATFKYNLFTPAFEGDPDSFGYRYFTNISPDGPTFDYIDISGSQDANYWDHEDDVYRQIPIDFSFNFYGKDYNELFIGSNGYLTFERGDYSYYSEPEVLFNSDIPRIAAFFDDLISNIDKSGVYYKTIGAEPNRKLVVQWYLEDGFSSTPGTVDLEIILFEGSNDILFQYRDVTFDADDYDYGIGATIGIGKGDGQTALQYSYNQPSVFDGSAIRFAAPFILHQGYSETEAELVLNIPEANLLQGETSIKIIKDTNSSDVTGSAAITVVSSTSANISLDLGLAPGSYTVRLTTGEEILNLPLYIMPNAPDIDDVDSHTIAVSNGIPGAEAKLYYKRPFIDWDYDGDMYVSYKYVKEVNANGDQLEELIDGSGTAEFDNRGAGIYSVTQTVDGMESGYSRNIILPGPSPGDGEIVVPAYEEDLIIQYYFEQDMEVVDLGEISVSNGVYGSDYFFDEDGILSILWDYDWGATYSVNIPSGSFRTVSGSVYNDEISWSFTVGGNNLSMAPSGGFVTYALEQPVGDIQITDMAIVKNIDYINNIINVKKGTTFSELKGALNCADGGYLAFFDAVKEEMAGVNDDKATVNANVVIQVVNEEKKTKTYYSIRLE